jgi:surface antigen
MKRLAVVAISAVLLAGCAENGPKQNAGALLGAVAGGLLGGSVTHGSGQAVAVGAGAFLGAVAGSEIGRSLDQTDRLYMARTQQSAFETARSGQTITWVNPDTGHGGAITPKPAYQQGNGEYCREYTQKITVGGRTETGYGTACRQPDGSWKIIS